MQSYFISAFNLFLIMYILKVYSIEAMHVGKKSFDFYYTCQNYYSYCTHTLPVCVPKGA